MGSITFSSKLVQPAPGMGSWTFAYLPKSASAKLPGRGNVRIVGTINGFRFRTSAQPDGSGSHVITVNKSMRDGARAGPGDTVRFEIEVDRKPRPIRIPSELKRALASNPVAKETFDAWAPSHKRAVVEYVAEAKQVETRERRAAKTIEMLAAGAKRWE